MPKANLTNTSVAAIKPAATPVEYLDTKLKGFLLRVQPSGSKSFYCQWGRGQRKVLGDADALTAEQARTMAKGILAQHYQGTDPRAEARAAKAAITLAKFVDGQYAEWVLADHRDGAATIARLRRDFPHLMPKQLSALTKWDIDGWRARALKAGQAPATVNRTLNVLQGAMRKAVKWKLIPTTPFADDYEAMKVDKKKIVRYLDEAETARLMAALDGREDYLRAMVLVSLNTGVRRGELFSLKWNSVDLRGGMLTVHGTTSKNETTRQIPLNATALAALKEWKRKCVANYTNDGLVFASNKTGVRFDNCRKAWATLLRETRIKNFRWHDMRHTFASHLVQRGVDLATVRELLGHSDFALTLRYSHLAPSQKVLAVAKLG